jgi:hypothetical protein
MTKLLQPVMRVRDCRTYQLQAFVTRHPGRRLGRRLRSHGSRHERSIRAGHRGGTTLSRETEAVFRSRFPSAVPLMEVECGCVQRILLVSIVYPGKVGGASTSTAIGGQETTLFSVITNLLHSGMVIVGLDYGQSWITSRAGGSSPNASWTRVVAFLPPGHWRDVC